MITSVSSWVSSIHIGACLVVLVAQELGAPSVTAEHSFLGSDAGGGGERVLWAAVRALQQSANGSNIVIMVYTGDVASERGVDQMVAKVQVREARLPAGEITRRLIGSLKRYRIASG